MPPGDGTGGATSTTTTDTSSTSGGGGAGGSGGGCVSDCGERLCGVDVCGDSCGPLLDTWALAVPHHTADLTLHEASSSLFVPGDLTTVERVNLCTGEILASTTIGDPNAVDPHYQRGAGLIGDNLLIGTNYQDKVGEVFVLDRRTLAESAAPIPVAALTAPDNIWTATVHDGAFWLSPDNDGDAIIRVDPVSRQATRYDFGTQSLGRGIVSTPYGLVKNWGDKRLALFDTTQCTTTCPAPATLGPLDTLAFKIKYGANAIFHVSFDGDIGTLTRVDMPGFTTVTKVVNDPGAGLDGWVDVAVWNDIVYLSGASGGIAGLPWLAAYPANFDDQSVPMYETFLDSKGDVNWSITADQFGVYVSGNTSTGGYVIKCTHELDCPPLP